MAECKDIEVYKPPDLNARLKEEQDFLHGVFWPQKYPILYENNEPYFEHNVELKGELGDRKYKLRVYMSGEYPNKMPNLVVCESPEPMPDGPHWNGSHATHTYRRIHGFLHICHWDPVAWGEQYWIFHVFRKGKKWLKAYEKYLVTKKLPLELKQMELTEEEKQRVEQQQLVQVQLVQSQLEAAFQTHQLQLNLLNQLWSEILHMFGVTSNILLHHNLPTLPDITDDEKENMQRRLAGSEYALQRVNEGPDGIMLAQLYRLRCALIIECKAVWPNWLMVLLKFLSHRLMMVSMWPIGYMGPPSLQQ